MFRTLGLSAFIFLAFAGSLHMETNNEDHPLQVGSAQASLQHQNNDAASNKGSDNLRKKYGQPYLERFQVSPEISVALAYTANGQACQIVIESPRSLSQGKQDEVRYMDEKEVAKLIDELVSRVDRGLYLGTYDEQMGCAHETVIMYEKVTISRNENACVVKPAERMTNASITFKKRKCAVTNEH